MTENTMMMDMDYMDDMTDMDYMNDMNGMTDIDSCNEDPLRGIFNDAANVIKAAPYFARETLEAAREQLQAAQEKVYAARRLGNSNNDMGKLMRASFDANEAFRDAENEYKASIDLLELACIASGFTTRQTKIWVDYLGHRRDAGDIAKELKTKESKVWDVLNDKNLDLDFSHGVDRLQCLQKVLADECDRLQNPKGKEVN